MNGFSTDLDVSRTPAGVPGPIIVYRGCYPRLMSFTPAGVRAPIIIYREGYPRLMSRTPAGVHANATRYRGCYPRLMSRTPAGVPGTWHANARCFYESNAQGSDESPPQSHALRRHPKYATINPSATCAANTKKHVGTADRSVFVVCTIRS